VKPLFGGAKADSRQEKQPLFEKAAQKLLFMLGGGAEGSGGSTVGIAPKGMGVVTDTAQDPA
jgi:hypothetical protein